jgi:hypothetical protein
MLTAVDLGGQKAHKLKRSCRRGMLLLGEEPKGQTWLKSEYDRDNYYLERREVN